MCLELLVKIYLSSKLKGSISRPLRMMVRTGYRLRAQFWPGEVEKTFQNNRISGKWITVF